MLMHAVLVVAMVVSNGRECNGERIRVEIKNIKGRGSSLYVHCKSAELDLGGRHLRYWESFYFEFEVSSWDFRSTCFYCSFKGTGWSGLRWFDVYREGQIRSNPNHLTWYVLKNKICTNNNIVLSLRREHDSWGFAYYVPVTYKQCYMFRTR